MQFIEFWKNKFVEAAQKIVFFGCFVLGLVILVMGGSFVECTGHAWYQPEIHNACITSNLTKYMGGIAGALYVAAFSWVLGVLFAVISGFMYTLSVIAGLFMKKHE